MRQVVSVFLLFSLLVSSAGFTLSKHFCGEELAHVTLNETKTCCESEDMPSDCCHDEVDQLLLDDFQLDHQSLQLSPLTFFTLSVVTQYLSFSPRSQRYAFPVDDFPFSSFTCCRSVPAGAVFLNLEKLVSCFAV